MNCIVVTGVIVQQVWQWVQGFYTYLVTMCQSITSFVTEWQQQWQTVCSQVTTSIQQWQSQEQNQCEQTSSTVCGRLPWPLNGLCKIVSSFVCNIITVLVLVVVTIVQVVCSVVSVLIQVVRAIIDIVCSIVALVITVFTLGLVIFVITIFMVLCTLIPCRTRFTNLNLSDNGWIVTLGLPTPPMLTYNNIVEVLPDGQLVNDSISVVIAAANKTIHIIQLEFDVDFPLLFNGDQPDLTLVQALKDAANRGVAVRILLNNNLFASSIGALRPVFSDTPGVQLAGIRIQQIKHFGMMHAKGMFIDSGMAFVDGLPFSRPYWDTQSHIVDDPRRDGPPSGTFTPVGQIGNGIGKKPVHTVSLKLIGPSATNVDETFAALWNSVSSNQVITPPVYGGDGQQTVQIVRSGPPSLASGMLNERGVLEGHLRAIHNASDFIYIEIQYLTYPPIATALIRAMTARRDLELILLINENPDLPTYKFWQNRLLNQLGGLTQRIGMFSLWRLTAPDEEVSLPKIEQIYVEAKASIVDDVWASIGSGNLDGASLDQIFEFLPSPLSCLSAANSWRNVELNAILYDGIADQPSTGEVYAIRRTLWMEHLGRELPEERPPGGWLSWWRQIAMENIASLNTVQRMTGDIEEPSRILPYSPQLQTLDQLRDIGVDISLFDVAPVLPT